MNRLKSYRGRIAPSPTGYLHLGHARTFSVVGQRAADAAGELVLRIDDLDAARCKPEFIDAALDDLAWLGLSWVGDPMFQSQRGDAYLAAWRSLLDAGHLFPCSRSRRDVREAASAPHGGEGEAVYPMAWRPSPDEPIEAEAPAGVNWRFRVPKGRVVSFEDAMAGSVSFVAGEDFGDFILWRKDDTPAYELAVVVDDHAQGITEVVRGMDLLLSTARQLLVYEALGLAPPAFCHVPLVLDEAGERLAKRTGALGLRELRATGRSAEDCLRQARLET